MELTIVLWLALVPLALAEDFTENCPRSCSCKWVSGNKAAYCMENNLTEIPNLNADIQILDLSGNPLYEIQQRAFNNIRLVNLKKLFLRSCNLQTIHKDGLVGLKIMIELDLSNNELAHLPPDTFRETEKIRWIMLNNNKLEKLDDNLFQNLYFLQKVELNNNNLFRIGQKTFNNVPKLSILKLSGNKLAHMKMETLSRLSALTSLELADNPWRCDCNLQPFRSWVLQRKLYTSPTSCSEPQQLAGKMWNELDATDFACRPSVEYPAPGTVVRGTGGVNTTLACHVRGNPLPDVKWVLDSRVLTDRPDGRYRFSEENEDSEGLSKWVNLTIVDLRAADAGQYKCVAQNGGGIEERGVAVSVNQRGAGATVGVIDPNLLPLLIGISVGLAVLLLIAAVSCYCYCRRRGVDKLNKTGGDALLEGSVIPEMEKSLMTGVNPVTKPPRRYDAPSLASAGTEMSDLNKTLLDNDSVFAANEEESRSLDLDNGGMGGAGRVTASLGAEYARLDPRAYPPDLLAFPPRAPVSPAASSASTAPDTTRLIPHPLSPGFRTLPYSRSQSPAHPPVITPRQGYVTIPRRPRVPSWASAASAPVHVLPTSEAQEPLYDNLGLRTTADGSSVLSLNKSGLEPLLSPMKGRPLPATPQSIYAPIAEHEPLYTSSPYRAAAAPQEAGVRASWAAPPQPEPRKHIETGSLRRPAPGKEEPAAREVPKARKTPPRPPPKPKKKTSPDSKEPLFEDEGEDGTEV